MTDANTSTRLRVISADGRFTLDHANVKAHVVERLPKLKVVFVERLPAPGVEMAESDALVREQLIGVPDAERDLIVHDNAQHVWSL